jgi:eukaryotic-like serine/threonine-protein kinase
MTPERWQRIKELLHQAQNLAVPERPAFLARTCAADPDLKEQLETLLASSDEARSSFLESCPMGVVGPGTRLGDYEIQKLLGSGGMGEVYRARDTRLRRDVAVKVLPPFFAADKERLRRFEQEAQAAAALNHPNILAVFQMGTFEGSPYLVSELLEGETLREQIKRGPVPVRKVVEQGVQIAHGLAAAHEKGIVHRDLKPENLFLTREGRVKILDFGLAKLKQAKQERQHSSPTVGAAATEPGIVMGTAAYMSPEQVRAKSADSRTDIFAFGTILYEMLTGKKAFQKATSAETMTAILNEEPPAVSQLAQNIPPALQRMIHRCLEKQPEQRFQSASDLAFALEALSDSGITAAPRATRAALPKARWRAAALAAVAAVVLISAFLWWQFGRNRGSQSGSPTIHSLAVLPLENLSGDPNQEYFSDGMTEELITDLSQIKGVKVISRKSVMRYKKGDKTLSQIAQELGVDGIIEGSVRRSGDQVRISAQLIYAPTETTLWAHSYEQDVKNALAVQSALASTIADEIKAQTDQRTQAKRSTNQKALDAYLRGEYQLGRDFYPRDVDAAIKSFKQAIADDPNFALAYVKLANAYAASLDTFAKTTPLQRSALEKALSLDPSLADAHCALANLQFRSDYDFAGAEREFKRALELNPRDAGLHDSLAGYLDDMGRFDEALRESEIAQELDFNTWGSMGLYLYFTRQYDRGIELMKRVVEIHPEDAVGEWWQLFHLYSAKGMQAETVEAWRRTGLALGYGKGAEIIQKAHAEGGYRAALERGAKWAEEETARGNFDFPYALAETYVLVGNKDKVFFLLDKAYERRDGALVDLAVSPIFDPVRSDPRYRALVKKIGFPQTALVQ